MCRDSYADRTTPARLFAGGFTIVEVMMVIAIMGVVSALLWTGMSSFADRQSFRSTVADIKSGMVDMRQQTLASKHDTMYGFHVSSTAVTFFSGDTFVDGAPANVVFNLPERMTANYSFSGGTQSVVFTRLTGAASATGTVYFYDASQDGHATITINATGLIE